MRTLAEKQKPAVQTKSASLAKPDRPHLSQGREVQPILQLQRVVGNQAVQRLLQANGEEREDSSLTSTSPCFSHDFSRIPLHVRAQPKIQPKLTINTPGDIYEQEADRVAKQVMEKAEPQLQRNCGYGGGCPKCQKDQQRDYYAGLQISRVGAHGLEQSAVSPIVHEALRSPGRPLDPLTRAFMETRFRHDFGQVRVHSDRKAEQSAQALLARAYTLGRSIVFGTGQYQPLASSGRALIAHELVHVLQQHQVPGSSIVQRNDDEMTRRGRRFASRQPPGSQRQDIAEGLRTRPNCSLNPHGSHLPPVGTAHRPPAHMLPCLLTESQVRASPRWCLDVWQRHRGETCYREIPHSYCASAAQYCYTQDGCCHDSLDQSSPVTPDSSGKGQECATAYHCILDHIQNDVL